jgi:cytochrome bd ubiquinol oxidase subunit I
MIDAVLLARIQFAITAGFHFLYPPLSIGLGLLLVIMEWRYIATKNKLYEIIVKFWVKVFALVFAVGVSTGIVMEFEFGTNWASYSRYVGDIFGSPLAAEALISFFLESVFLGVLIFGWNKVSPKMHFFSTIMVALGAMLSAFWIIVANSWMQTPGIEGEVYRIVGEGGSRRAEILDFWAMVFNPSTIDRFTHVIVGAWLTGTFFVMSISSYYLLKKKHIEFAKSSLKIALGLAIVASFLQLVTGDKSAVTISKFQPAKLAAYEGHFNTSPADLYILGWVDEQNQKAFGIAIPGFLSYLVHGDASKPVVGLNEFPNEVRPPVQLIFQTYHLMIAIGMLMILICCIALILLWRDKLFTARWLLYILVPSFILPQLANEFGWIHTEVGRQPWAVYGVLRTSDAVSQVVSAGQIWFSMVMFTGLYTAIGVLFVFLLLKKIKTGPEEIEIGVKSWN